jgi:hypothetical protein
MIDGSGTREGRRRSAGPFPLPSPAAPIRPSDQPSRLSPKETVRMGHPSLVATVCSRSERVNHFAFMGMVICCDGG